MIQAAIFDFGRVLADFDFTIACEKFEKRCKISAQEIQRILCGDTSRRVEMHRAFERGEVAPHDFYGWACKQLGLTDVSEREFFEIFGNILSSKEGITEVLEDLGTSLNLFMLSNTNSAQWEYIRRLDVIRRFFGSDNQQVLSFRLGARKPDGRIYREAVRRTGVSIQECLYVDDIPEFVNAFEQLGGKGVHYNCRHEDVEILRERLAELLTH
ncbi:MAG: hypothetical protein COU08_02395 [Candidatus Harrisonbacteria bacterium CG10_big_fil_rev_8_21_14_0_10_42_17]|uniref:HAD family phosphatase n=1 Tax=Candidatus Harrisonbacteria bacterium CG10_big_fil_rev_8_21_14_0_10_42_17 TaxID=1974584 RepID=A0A2M6WI15_9BACT|nr:MAG: hypothetical protein COU08_02395 [Candidatus Harrisonbacteria bacterium CG10_big_fil_rev_8_21_14_0_10_42_17]